MKKVNLWLGLIASIVFFLGNVFKIQHWPGAAFLMVTGACIGIVFIIMFLSSETANLKGGKEKNNAIVGGITMIVVLIGFMFKIQHWPGANIMVYLGHALLLIYGITLFIDAFNETDKNKQSIKALMAFGVFVLMSILIILGLGTLLHA